MKAFIKQKSYGRLLSFLKFKRHKKIRTLICSSRRGADRDARGMRDPGDIVKQKRQTQSSYFLKRLDSFGCIESSQSERLLSMAALASKADPKHLETANVGSTRSLQRPSVSAPQMSRPPRTANGVAAPPGQPDLSKVGGSAATTAWFSSETTRAQNRLCCNAAFGSVLFNIICKLPGRRSGGYIKSIQGTELTGPPSEMRTQHYTIPYRLSLSRFVGNKILRLWNPTLGSASMRNLRKKLLIRAKRCSGATPLQPLSSFFCGFPASLKKQPRSKQEGGEATSPNVLEGGRFFGKQEKEIAKNFILGLESRLDSSLSRLLQFKALYTFKHSRVQKLKSRSGARTANGPFSAQNHKVKSPWKNYSMGQVKQKINHGHIYLNGKKVKSGNIRLGLGDLVSYPSAGFVSSFAWTENHNKPSFGSLAESVALRASGCSMPCFSCDGTRIAGSVFNMKWKRAACSAFFKAESHDAKAHSGDFSVDEFFRNGDVVGIKNFKIKRFTEMFYITYKNLHLFARDKSFAQSAFTPGHLGEEPFFQTIGYSQSIYFLWPALCILSVRNWGPEIKRNIIRSSGSESVKGGKNVNSKRSNDQKNLRHLLTQKKLQTAKTGTALAKSDGATKGKMPMLDRIAGACNLNPSWVYAKSMLCYATVVYGTRKCKWVQLQQRRQGDFYNRICNKLQFFELELDFFQLAYRHYKG